MSFDYGTASNSDLLAIDIALERRLKIQWVDPMRKRWPELDALLKRAVAVDEEIDRRRALGTWEES